MGIHQSLLRFEKLSIAMLLHQCLVFTDVVFDIECGVDLLVLYFHLAEYPPLIYSHRTLIAELLRRWNLHGCSRLLLHFPLNHIKHRSRLQRNLCQPVLIVSFQPFNIVFTINTYWVLPHNYYNLWRTSYQQLSSIMVQASVRLAFQEMMLQGPPYRL